MDGTKVAFLNETETKGFHTLSPERLPLQLPKDIPKQREETDSTIFTQSKTRRGIKFEKDYYNESLEDILSSHGIKVIGRIKMDDKIQYIKVQTNDGSLCYLFIDQDYDISGKSDIRIFEKCDIDKDNISKSRLNAEAELCQSYPSCGLLLDVSPIIYIKNSDRVQVYCEKDRKREIKGSVSSPIFSLRKLLKSPNEVQSTISNISHKMKVNYSEVLAIKTKSLKSNIDKLSVEYSKYINLISNMMKQFNAVMMQLDKYHIAYENLKSHTEDTKKKHEIVKQNIAQRYQILESVFFSSSEIMSIEKDIVSMIELISSNNDVLENTINQMNSVY